MRRRLFALFICIVHLASVLPVQAMSLEEANQEFTEAELREAILGDEMWLERYPQGMFNLLAGEISLSENQEFYEFAVVRQGGTTGDVSVDIKAFDINAQYGKDYTIRIYGDESRTDFVEAVEDEDSLPLMDLLEDDSEINISEPAESIEDGTEELDGEESGAKPGTDEPGSGENPSEELPGEDGAEAKPPEGSDSAGQPEDGLIEGNQSDDSRPAESGQNGGPDGSEPATGEAAGERQGAAAGPNASPDGSRRSVQGFSGPSRLPSVGGGLTGGQQAGAPEGAEGSAQTSQSERVESPKTADEINGGTADSSGSQTTDNSGENAGASDGQTANDPAASGEDRQPEEPRTSAGDENYTELESVKGDRSLLDEKQLSLREAKALYTGIESDRANWRQIDVDEAMALEAAYTEFYDELPGAVGTIHFADGEYIKYLRIIPVDHAEPSGDRVGMLVLNNPTGGAVRGDFYTASLLIQDDRQREPGTFHIKEQEVTAEGGKAKVTVIRSGNLVDTESVLIGTVEGNAVAEADYLPGLKELTFTPGMSRQTVYVDVLPNQYRQTPRQFYIVLDQDNVRTSQERWECIVTIPPDPEAMSAEEISSQKLAAMSAQGWAPADGAAPFAVSANGAELISARGTSAGPGIWRMSGHDFMERTTNSSTRELSDYTLWVDYKSGTRDYFNTSTKLYGVDHITFRYENNGYGKVNTFLWWDYSHVYKYNLQFLVNGSSLYTKSEKVSPEVGENVSIGEGQWNSNSFGFRSHADSQNSTAPKITNIQLHLKRYTANTIAADQLVKTTYLLENNGTLSVESEQQYSPGSMKISSVVSNVQNSSTPNSASAGVYRSDLIKFTVEYSAANPGGQFAYYDGFRIKNGSKWIEFRGDVRELLLDEAFFKKSGVLDAVRSGRIEIQPIFEQRDATLQLETGQSTVYYANAPQTPLKLTGKVGDQVNGIHVRSRVLSMTPELTPRSSRYSDGSLAVVCPDLLTVTDTSDGITASIAMGDVFTSLTATVHNASLTVMADPANYAVMPSEVVYEVDGQIYTDHQSYADRMMQVVTNDEDPRMAISFDVVYGKAFSTDYIESHFGEPKEAVLQVYSTLPGGSIREKAPVIIPYDEQQGFVMTGRLSDFEWMHDDFATVKIRGVKRDGTETSTAPVAIDFMQNSRDGVLLSLSGELLTGGDVYSPIEKEVSGVRTYQLNSAVNTGFTAYWTNYSPDFNGDGEIDSAEKKEAVKLLKSLGFAGEDIDKTYDTTRYYGSTFFITPAYFPETKIYYNIVPQEKGIREETVRVWLYREMGTILDPEVGGNIMPVANAVVVVGGVALENTDGNTYEATDSSFERSQNYSGYAIANGFTYYFAAKPGDVTTVKLKESETMRPVNFSVTNNGKAVDFSKDRYVELVNDSTVFSYQFDDGEAAVRPNDSIIRVYDETYSLQHTYHTGAPDADGYFSFAVDTKAAGFAPGWTVSVAGVFDDGGNDRVEYPEVFSGLTFSRQLTALTIAASFDTPVSKTLNLFGEISGKYDLGLDIPMSDKFDVSTEIDDVGRERTYKTITFGFDKDDVEKLLKKLKGDGKKANKESSDDPKPEGKTQAEMSVDQAAGGNEKEKVENAANNSVKDNASRKVSGKGSASFDFSIAFTVVLEEGLMEDVSSGGNAWKGDGEHYFSALVMVATAKANASYTATYVTPIGIPVFATVKGSGTAAFTYGMEADPLNPYSTVYCFDGDGNIAFNTDNYLMYVKFYAAPAVTLSAGAGVDLLKAFVSGKAEFDLAFYTPVFSDQPSTGNGGVTFSASVGVKVLFVAKEWELYKSDRLNLFAYGDSLDVLNDPRQDQSYRQLGEIGEDDILDRSYLAKKGGWLGSSGLRLDRSVTYGEMTLIENAYPYPQTKMLRLSDARVLLLFIDDDPARDDRNRAVLKYSVWDGSVWSEPEAVYDDGTWDEEPDAFMVGDQALIVWSDAVAKYDETHDEADALSCLSLTGIWMDAETLELSAPFAITHSETGEMTADMHPRISASNDLSQLMVYYTKVDYQNDGWETSVHLSDDEEAIPEADAALYGDLVNGYNVVAYRVAERQADGTYEWSEEYDDSLGLSEAQKQALYGQHFPKLAVPATLDEHWVYDAGGEPVEFSQNAHYDSRNPKDPRVIDTALTDYKFVDYRSGVETEQHWSLLAYTVDLDGDLKTMEDRRLYLLIYDFVTDEFSNPILLTNYEGYNSEPQFVELDDGSVHLFWLGDGNVLSMDMRSLSARGNLHGEEGQVRSYLGLIELPVQGLPAEEAGTLWPTILAVNKENGNDQINLAVDCDEDTAVIDFSVQTNGTGVFLTWIQNTFSHHDEEAENSHIDNMIPERQIFASYASYDENEHALHRWSRPIQLTDRTGANYSDLSFLVTEEDHLAVSYILYEQEKDEKGRFVDNTDSRTLEAARYYIASDLAPEGIWVEDETVSSGSPLVVSATVRNDGLKPVTGLQYRFRATKDGSVLIDTGWADAHTDDEEEIGSLYQIGGLLGGTAYTASEYLLLEDYHGITVSYAFRADVHDEQVLELVLAEEEDVSVMIEQMDLTGEDTVHVRLILQNNSSKPFAGPLQIGEVIHEEIYLEPFARIRWIADISINGLVFEDSAVTEDGIISDKLALPVSLGESTADGGVPRVLAGERAEAVQQVESFRLQAEGSLVTEGGKLTLDKDESLQLTPLIQWRSTEHDELENLLEVTYSSADEDVAVVLKDGSVYGLGKGTTEITAVLRPAAAAVQAANDGYEVIDSQYLLPAAAVQTVEFTLAVNDPEEGGGGSSGSSGGGRGRPVGGSDGEEPVEPDEPEEDPQFSDVKESDWFYEAVITMAKKGILSGMGDGTFRPLEDVKRADFLIMIMRQFGLAPEENETWEDNFLDAGQTYHTPYLAKAKALGIASGVGGNLFAPEESISRQDMFVMLYNILVVLDKLPEEEELAEAKAFTDFADVADYAKESVRILSAMGVVNGSDGKVMPQDSSKRCEAAQILYGVLLLEEAAENGTAEEPAAGPVEGTGTGRLEADENAETADADGIK